MQALQAASRFRHYRVCENRDPGLVRPWRCQRIQIHAKIGELDACLAVVSVSLTNSVQIRDSPPRTYVPNSLHLQDVDTLFYGPKKHLQDLQKIVQLPRLHIEGLEWQLATARDQFAPRSISTPAGKPQCFPTYTYLLMCVTHARTLSIYF